MLSLETSIQLTINVRVPDVRINDLAAALPALGREVSRAIVTELVESVQEAHFERVLLGEEVIVCTRCGVEHTQGGVVRRGSRMRKLRSSSGEIRFRLHQITCRDCSNTWSPYAELLGLEPRRRIAEELEKKLVATVTDLSYEKTTRLADEWLGATVSPRTLHRRVQVRGEQVTFTPVPDCDVVVADGTKVPAGRPRFGTDVRVAFQLLADTTPNGRSVLRKRIAGWSIGAVGWSQALRPEIAAKVIVTDREAGIPEVIKAQHPRALHQLCEWHLGHTMKHLMALDRVPVREREKLASRLGRIIWGPGPHKRERYRAFWSRLRQSPRARAMLRASAAKILYETPSAVRVTSSAEREMREINRRTDVGVQWSVSGVNNMLKLRHALRLNRDDFERIWSPIRPVRFDLVPQA